jgi:SET domain-containing protein
MTKDEIIKDLENNIYCRIRPSKIQGTGVFAIRNIPKGTNPFITYTNFETIAISVKEIMENKKIPDSVKEMVKDFYVIQNGNFYCDARSLNEIDISYFVNHSKTPNLDAKDLDEETIFITNRDILAGEELTSDYSTYTDLYDNSEIEDKTNS